MFDYIQSWVSSNYHHPPKLRGRLIKYWSEVNIMVIASDGVCHFYFWCNLWLWHYWQFLALVTNFVVGFPRRFPFKDEKEINYNIFERSIFKQMLYGKSCVPRMLKDLHRISVSCRFRLWVSYCFIIWVLNFNLDFLQSC